MTALTYRFEEQLLNRKPSFRQFRLDLHRSLQDLATPIPSILLIDSDDVFAAAMARSCDYHHIPITAWQSHLSQRSIVDSGFGLVILDWETNGCEFATEIAAEIDDQNNHLPVLFIGEHAPKAKIQQRWSHNVLGFSEKSLGADGVLSDAIQAFAVSQENRRKRPNLRLVFGG